MAGNRRWWSLGVLCLSLLIVVIDNTIVNVALPTLSEDLGATTTELQWIVDAYTLVFASLLLAMGHVGDRFGRRLALLVGLGLFAAMSLLAAASQTAGQLIGARALMGIGAALVFPATLAILVNVFTDRRERAAAIGIWSACTGVAVALGPVTGGYLLEHYSWGSIFLVNIPVVLVAITAGALLVPPSRDASAGPLDRQGLLLSAAGVGLLVWSIIEAPHRGWTSAPILLAAGAGAALLALFVLWERRSPHPLLEISLFRNLRFSAASMAVAAAFFALFGFIFLITQFLQLVQGYSPLEAGLRTLPFAIATAAASPLAIVAMHRWGSKLVVGSGLAVMSAGFLIASRVDVDTPYVGLTLVSMVTMAVGLGLATGPATESIMGALPEAKAGVGSAVNDTTRELGGTLGVAVVGSVYASVYGSRLADALTSAGAPPEAVAVARESLAGALAVAQNVPGAAAQQLVLAAQESFVDGLAAGSVVAAAVAALGALVAFAFLPARAGAQSRMRQEPVPTRRSPEADSAEESSPAVRA
ncbi:MAG: DHA2 family efflux MFS transporter permease subunit [Actinomycetales bacterium]|nr:DHA2 family efflux MFS transporter permease subunit [Actinomycetales bacterium]